MLSIALAAMIKTGIVGEWAYIGECDKERHVYTATGNYFRMEKKKKEWKSVDSYMYTVDDTIVIIGEQDSDVVFPLKVESMTLSSFKFCTEEKDDWDCDIKFYFEKCGER